MGIKDTCRKPIYLVAAQGSGGASLYDSQYFESYEDAEKVRQLYWALGMPFMKLWTLYLAEYDPAAAASAAGRALADKNW